jgi:hypothetical protein
MLEYEQLAAENVVADFWELYSVEFVVRNFAAAAAAAAAEVDCAVVAAAVMKLRSVDVESQVQIVVVLVVELVASVVA